MGPINYQQQVANPLQQGLQGFQIGDAFRQRQLAQQAAQQQAAQQAAAEAEVRGIMTNPNATSSDLLRAVTLLPPQVAAQVNKAWEGRTAEQQQTALGHQTKVYAALKNGRPDVAAQLLEDRATALENSGQTEQAAAFRAQAKAATENPAETANMLGLSLAVMPGGKDAIESFGKLGTEQRAAELQPTAVRQATATADKTEADAKTAGVTAKYADSKALLELEEKGWNVKALQADIEFKKQSTRIAAMNASLAREGNDLKRQELQLKIEDAKSARDGKVREKVATAEAGANNIDNMLNTVERIKSNKSLNSVVGSLEGKSYYPNTVMGTANPFGNGDERADAIALIETLGSQAFLAQIPSIKGMGALSNTEGDKLQSALQNLSRAQSEGQFRANLDEAARLLKKGRESLEKSSGVPLGKPDTPAAPGTRAPIDSFFKTP